MWIEAIVPKEDLLSILSTLLPLKIHLDRDDTTERWLLLGRADSVDLVPDEGLRLRCAAEVRWSVSVIDVPISLHSLCLMLRPEIIEKPRGQVLAFGFEIVEADVAGLPAVIDGAVVRAVNDALGRKKLEWDFVKTLTRSFPMPEILEPIAGLWMKANWGKSRVSEEAMVLALSLDLSFGRREAESSAA